MKIAVFGATGRTGRRLVSLALSRGHEVSAFVRNTAGLPQNDKALRVIRGSLSDAKALVDFVKGADAVVIALGPRPPYKDVFTSDATAKIIGAMRSAGVSRLMAITGAMIGDYPENRTLCFRLMAMAARKKMPETFEDRKMQEDAVIGSGLQWTILKPPRLSEGNPKGRIIAGDGLRVGIMSSITTGGLAGFMLDELLTPRFTGRRVFLRH